MKRPAALITLLMAFALEGCIASTVVMHVTPDGRGRAFITSRVFESALCAFDSMFSESPKHAKTEEELPPPGLGELAQQFGTAAKLISTRLDLVQDGVQLGDVPGAVVPRDHEVFLEFEGTQGAPAAAPAAQAPPDTEIYLAPMRTTNGVLEIGPAVDITNNPGYDNQPGFTPDGRSVFFTSVRGPSGTTQTDIYRYDILPRQVVQVTGTPESEYSPTVTPTGSLSVVRVELDPAKTQRLWQFTLDGRDPAVVLENVKPVGYHAWVDDHTLALFVLGQPSTLQLADTRAGTAVVAASDIGRSIQRIPGGKTISFVQRERTGDTVNLVVKELDPSTRAISILTPAVAGSTEADCAWTPDGTLLMAGGGTLYGWRRGQSGWKEIVSLERLSLSGVTRLAVSPKGDYLALVAGPRQAR